MGVSLVAEAVDGEAEGAEGDGEGGVDVHSVCVDVFVGPDPFSVVGLPDAENHQGNFTDEVLKDVGDEDPTRILNTTTSFLFQELSWKFCCPNCTYLLTRLHTF